VVRLRRVDLAVVNVLATPEACDGLTTLDDAQVCRVAADESLLIGGAVLEKASGLAAGADPDALVLDVTEGWASWRLEGEDARVAFARVSELCLPGDGFIQGEVARVPAKVLVDDVGITLLVPAMVADHVRERIMADCRVLGVTEAVSS
jgi:hypothetical protein